MPSVPPFAARGDQSDMTQIVAGVFDDERAATAAAHELRGAGFEAADLDQFAVSRPSRRNRLPHGGLPLGGDGDPDPKPGDGETRPAGVMVAVSTEFSEDEEIAIDLMRDHGARMIERADGVWRNGKWTDFDPVRSPDIVEGREPSEHPGGDIGAPGARP